MRLNRHPRWLAMIAVIAIALITQLAAPARADGKRGRGEPVQLLDAIQSARAEEDRAVQVAKAEIDMGHGVLVIDEGVLVPATPVEGQMLEVAFAGDAWFRFATSDPVEIQQLEMFTGETALLTPITHAVLVAGDPAVFERLLAGEPATGPRVEEASKHYKEWDGGAERQGFAADIAMVKSILGDPLAGGYFAVWARSEDHGDIFYSVDPSEAEPVTLGQFVPLDMSSLDVWQRRLIKNIFRIYGPRFANFSSEFPGSWDTWVSLGRDVGQSAPAEPEHYTIDIYTNPKMELDSKGWATIRLRAGPAGARSIPLYLYPGLKVTGVTGPGGVPFDFIRREVALHVFLPEALAAGERIEIRVDYEGDMVAMLERNQSFALQDTQYWYPHAGQVDRATYDATFRHPKKYSVLASGKKTGDGVEEGVAWQRRQLDLPALGFTFEIGRFEIITEQVGHVALTVGFQGGSSSPEEEQRAKVIDTVKKALPYFEELFGPYPLDYLTVAAVDRDFSQGHLSMVTLAEVSQRTLDEEIELPERIKERIEEEAMVTIAHELSHQWWGNWVGWVSDRDRWLSEALASYSSLLFCLENTESRAAFLARNALDWRHYLMKSTREGRTVASLGPVTLGARLNSSKAPAYQAIVYEKGTVVLRMLARLLDEEAFTRMLGELARAVANRTIDTDTFLAALQKMSGMDLGPFAERFIDGTDIPEIYYRYQVDPKEDGEGWILSGRAVQMGSVIESLKVTRDASGVWSVQREVAGNTDPPAVPIIVPFQVLVTPPKEVHKGKKGTIQRARGFGGKMVIQGRETPFRYTIPAKPERFELDQLGEVLALFIDEGWNPKQALRWRALEMQRTGEIEQAEQLLLQALDSPVYSERAVAWIGKDRVYASSKGKKKGKDDPEAEREQRENARIHTLLARFQMDRGDVEGAQREIGYAEALLDDPDEEAGWRERELLKSRLDLAQGDAQAAYLRLKKGRFSWWLGPEGYALLAVAASESGHNRIAREMLEKAEARGVNMDELREARERVAASGG